MLETFRRKTFRPASETLIFDCDRIVNDYLGQGLRLTLRQLYYQLVVRNTITNTERSYQNLSRLVSDARLAGRLDWAAIEDRIRMPRTPTDWSDPASIMRSVVASFKLPRWDTQPYYIELWVEKDALAGVLQPIATDRHVTLMVNRGYSSQSAMYDAYERFGDADRDGKECVLLYLGDHDPSGEDMVRDIDERLNELFRVPVDVRKLAITPAQVVQYAPPPNPAKMSDSRAAAFVARYGPNSYEVDALPPNVLTEIINDAIDEYEDVELMAVVLAQEERDKTLLTAAGESIMASRVLDDDDQDNDESEDDDG